MWNNALLEGEDPVTFERDGADFTVCAAHRMETCGACCLDFSLMNADAREDARASSYTAAAAAAAAPETSHEPEVRNAEAAEHSDHLSEIEVMRAGWPHPRLRCSRNAFPDIPRGAQKLIHFVRHGQGHHNFNAKATGCTCNNGGLPACPYKDQIVNDAYLTELGRSQASENVAFTASREATLESVFVSPLTRAVETALLAFAGAADADTVPFISRENLREQHGMHVCDRRRSRTTISEEFPRVDFSQLETDNDPWWTEEREPKRCVADRGHAFLNGFLKRRPEQEVGVVAHSSFLLTMFNVVLNCEEDISLESWFNTGELRSVWVAFDDGGGSGGGGGGGDSVALTGTSKSDADDDDDDVCPICLMEMSPCLSGATRLLCCGKRMHIRCGKNLLKSNCKDKCPMCNHVQPCAARQP